MSLEEAKRYLGESWVLSLYYKREDNPAHTYKEGAYWLQPENIEGARMLTGGQS